VYVLKKFTSLILAPLLDKLTASKLVLQYGTMVGYFCDNERMKAFMLK